MRYVFLVLALAPVVVLVAGRLRGRETVKPCCAPAELDGRISAALTDGSAGADAPPVDPHAVR